MPTHPTDFVQWANAKTHEWYTNLKERVEASGETVPPLTAFLTNVDKKPTAIQRQQMTEQNDLFPLGSAMLTKRDAYQRLSSDGPFSVQIQTLEQGDRRQTL